MLVSFPSCRPTRNSRSTRTSATIGAPMDGCSSPGRSTSTISSTSCSLTAVYEGRTYHSMQRCGLLSNHRSITCWFSKLYVHVLSLWILWSSTYYVVWQINTISRGDLQCFLFCRNMFRSPRKLFIFIIKKNFSGSKYPREYFVLFWKRKHWWPDRYPCFKKKLPDVQWCFEAGISGRPPRVFVVIVL